MRGFGRFNRLLWSVKNGHQKKDLIFVQKVGDTVMTGIDKEAFKGLSLNDYKEIAAAMNKIVDFVAEQVEKIEA